MWRGTTITERLSERDIGKSNKHKNSEDNLLLESKFSVFLHIYIHFSLALAQLIPTKQKIHFQQV